MTRIVQKASTLVIAVAVAVGPAHAADFQGPGRFCGYSAVIDLVPGEEIEVLAGGMHGGTFVWKGPFGSLEVANGGWARKPPGFIEKRRTRAGQAQAEPRKRDGRYTLTIWNGAAGRADFHSDRKFTAEQLAAIERVGLFDESSGAPADCRFRTAFSLD